MADNVISFPKTVAPHRRYVPSPDRVAKLAAELERVMFAPPASLYAREHHIGKALSTRFTRNTDEGSNDEQ